MNVKTIRFSDVRNIINKIMELEQKIVDCDVQHYHKQIIKIINKPSLQEIKNVEKLINCKLPNSYINYQTKLDWFPKKYAFNTIVNLNDTIKISLTLLEANILLRDKMYFINPLPDFLIVYDSTASIDGDYFCFDTRYPNEYGEYPIVYWTPDEPDYLEFKEGKPNQVEIVDDLKLVYQNFYSHLFIILNEDYKKLLELYNYWGQYP